MPGVDHDDVVFELEAGFFSAGVASWRDAFEVHGHLRRGEVDSYFVREEGVAFMDVDVYLVLAHGKFTSCCCSQRW